MDSLPEACAHTARKRLAVRRGSWISCSYTKSIVARLTASSLPTQATEPILGARWMLASVSEPFGK